MATKRRRIHALVNQKIFEESDESTVQREKDSVTSKYFLNEKIRLSSDFYEKPCIDLAKSFLGQILVRKLPDGSELRGKIVETESYLGGEDEASHSRGGKRTQRNAAMYMKPGTIYVYQIYGVYFCMNISSKVSHYLPTHLQGYQNTSFYLDSKQKSRPNTQKALLEPSGQLMWSTNLPKF